MAKAVKLEKTSWTRAEEALFRRAFVKYGPSAFASMSENFPEKSNNDVCNLYFFLGATSGPLKPLADLHKQLKRNGQLDSYLLRVSAKEISACRGARIASRTPADWLELREQGRHRSSGDSVTGKDAIPMTEEAAPRQLLLPQECFMFASCGSDSLNLGIITPDAKADSAGAVQQLKVENGFDYCAKSPHVSARYRKPSVSDMSVAESWTTRQRAVFTSVRELLQQTKSFEDQLSLSSSQEKEGAVTKQETLARRMSRDAGRFGKILSLQHWDIMICRWILSAIARHSKDLYSILLQYLKVLLPVIPKGLRRVFCTSEVEQIGEANMSVDCISTPRRKRPSDIFSNDNSQTKGSRPTQQTMNDCVSQLQRQNKLSSTVRQEKRPLARDEPLQKDAGVGNVRRKRVKSLVPNGVRVRLVTNDGDHGKSGVVQRFQGGGWYIIELDDVSPINDKRLVTYRSGSFQVVKSSIISDEVSQSASALETYAAEVSIMQKHRYSSDSKQSSISKHGKPGSKRQRRESSTVAETPLFFRTVTSYSCVDDIKLGMEVSVCSRDRQFDLGEIDGMPQCPLEDLSRPVSPISAYFTDAVKQLAAREEEWNATAALQEALEV